MAVIIFGPQATGKTFNAERFRELYGCSRIVDDWPSMICRGEPRSRDLVLTNMPRDEIANRVSKFHRLVPIAMARKEARLSPLPARGAFR